MIQDFCGLVIAPLDAYLAEKDGEGPMDFIDQV